MDARKGINRFHPADISTRSRGRSGNLLYFSGRLGLVPARITPRLALGKTLLRRRLATACMDLSDGLSTDLHHLCNGSGVGAVVHATALTPGALNRGEDYELLFTARPSTRIPPRIAGVPITCIGGVTHNRAVLIEGADGKRRPLEPR